MCPGLSYGSVRPLSFQTGCSTEAVPSRDPSSWRGLSNFGTAATRIVTGGITGGGRIRDSAGWGALRGQRGRPSAESPAGKSEARQDYLAFGRTLFQHRVRPAQVVSGNGTKMGAQRGTDRLAINPPGDAGQYVMLTLHIVGLIQRAGKHQLPVSRDRFVFERHRVQRGRIVNDPQFALRRNGLQVAGDVAASV